MSKTTQHISPTMHYTVVIALIISLITTFLLGMLLTETLWGGGLGYFSNLRHEAQVNRQKIQFMESIRSQLQTQEASAAQLGGSNRPIHFGSNFGDLLDRPIQLPQPRYREAVYYGVVTSVHDPFNKLDDSIQVGSAIRAHSTYSDQPSYDGQEGAEWGDYTTDGYLTVSVENSNWNTGKTRFVVHNALPGLEYMAIQNNDLYSDFYVSAQASWENNSETITSNALPENWTSDTDSSNQNEFIVNYEANYDDYWIINATVDRVEFSY